MIRPKRHVVAKSLNNGTNAYIKLTVCNYNLFLCLKVTHRQEDQKNLQVLSIVCELKI
jgi:hypothetical protein